MWTTFTIGYYHFIWMFDKVDLWTSKGTHRGSCKQMQYMPPLVWFNILITLDKCRKMITDPVNKLITDIYGWLIAWRFFPYIHWFSERGFLLSMYVLFPSIFMRNTVQRRCSHTYAYTHPYKRTRTHAHHTPMRTSEKLSRWIETWNRWSHHRRLAVVVASHWKNIPP
jgi:hypothetical protein